MKLTINNANDHYSITFDPQISRYRLKKGKAVYDIADIVIYDSTNEREMFRSLFKEVGIQAVPSIFSIGTGEQIVKRRKLDLSKKEVFVYSTKSTHYIVEDYYKSAVDLYIPSDYFTLRDMTVFPSTVDDDKEVIGRISSVFTETLARLSYTYVDADESEEIGQFLFHQRNQAHSIREWKYLDLMDWFDNREKEYEALEKELDELYKKNLPTNEVIAYRKKMAARIAERYSFDMEGTVSAILNKGEPYQDKMYELTMNHETDFFENFLK